VEERVRIRFADNMAFRQMMVVAGEASGDRHAASLLTELAKRLPETRFFGMGGPLLEAAGLERIYAADEVSVMGITEVVPKLPRILRVMKGLTQTAARRLPVGAISSSNAGHPGRVPQTVGPCPGPTDPRFAARQSKFRGEANLSLDDRGRKAKRLRSS